MKRRFSIRSFRKDDDGAVVVDWVVLTAAIVGLGFVAVGTVGTAAQNASTATAEAIATSGEAGGMTTEEFLSSYQPLSSTHDSNWARSAYERTKSMSDEQLQQRYDRAYQRASSGTSARGADRAAVFERALADRGIDRPAGNRPASSFRQDYS